MALDELGRICGSYKATCRIRRAKGLWRQLPEVSQERRGNSRSWHHLLGELPRGHAPCLSGANPGEIHLCGWRP